MRSPTHRTPETRETDVLVVGSGMASWTVARRGQQAGLDVTVVDNATPGVSQGFPNAAYLGMIEDPAVLKTYAREVTSGVGRDELIDAWADNCGRALDWLRGEGVEIGQLPERRERLYILPFRVSPSSRDRSSRSPAFYLGGLGEAVVFGLLVAEHISRPLVSTVSGRTPTPLDEGARG